MIRTLVLCLTTLALFSSVCLADKFDRLDANHDGFLDRNEYSTLAHELRGAVEPFITVDGMEIKENVISGGTSSGWTSTVAEDFVSGVLNSLVVIIVTEIGDKTFFIAAVLAMRNGRMVVYLGCMVALAAMHVLSCLMGYALPALLPKVYTHYASALLFLYFGFRLLKDAHELGDGPSEELQEVEEELIEKKDASRMTSDDLEDNKPPESATGAYAGALKSEHLKVFTQALTLTFLAEWGDRSQIATIALASSKNPFGVIVGGLVGHALCTGVAVLGGRMLAARISERTVHFVGGILFLVCALHSFIVGP